MVKTKMKKFWINNKERILKIIGIIIILQVLSLICMLLLYLFGIIYFDDGIKLNVELFNRFKESWYGGFVLVGIQVVVTIMLSFIPGTSMACIILMQALFETPGKAFLLSFISVMISSTLMYFIGRVGGYKLVEKFLGTEDSQKASELMNHKGAVYFPLMMMFPIFPDDALVMIAGTLKMKLNWFIPSIVFGRGIGIATIVFGLGSVPYQKFTTPIHWILFILVCLIILCAVFYAAYRFNEYLEKKRK